MNKILLVTAFLVLVVVVGIGIRGAVLGVSTGAPPYGEPEDSVPNDPLAWLKNWVRPDVPAKVGIQVGHYKNEQLPEELEKLIGNTGSSGGGKTESEVNMAIALEMKEMLEDKGIVVDIIPATVPPGYWADLFVAVHADGNVSSAKSGYKFAAPWRDLTGDAGELAEKLNEKYGEDTGLEFDPNITRNMRGYYAFSWWRYDHAIHPMTTAIIAETGFLTNPRDRKLLINTPEVPAESISEVVIEYLKTKDLLD